MSAAVVHRSPIAALKAATRTPAAEIERDSHPSTTTRPHAQARRHGAPRSHPRRDREFLGRQGAQQDQPGSGESYDGLRSDQISFGLHFEKPSTTVFTTHHYHHPCATPQSTPRHPHPQPTRQGAYRDDAGKPVVLDCVREAERRVMGSNFME